MPVESSMPLSFARRLWSTLSWEHSLLWHTSLTHSTRMLLPAARPEPFPPASKVVTYCATVSRFKTYQLLLLQQLHGAFVIVGTALPHAHCWLLSALAVLMRCLCIVPAVAAVAGPGLMDLRRLDTLITEDVQVRVLQLSQPPVWCEAIVRG